MNSVVPLLAGLCVMNAALHWWLAGWFASRITEIADRAIERNRRQAYEQGVRDRRAEILGWSEYEDADT